MALSMKVAVSSIIWCAFVVLLDPLVAIGVVVTTPPCANGTESNATTSWGGCGFNFDTGTLDVLLLSGIRSIVHLGIVLGTLWSSLKGRSCCGTHGPGQNEPLQEPLLATSGEEDNASNRKGLADEWIDEETEQQKHRDIVRRRKNIALYSMYGTLEMASAVYGGTKVVMTPSNGVVATVLLVLASFMPYFCYGSITRMLRNVGVDPGRYVKSLHEHHVIRFYNKGTYKGRRIRCDRCRMNATRTSIYLCVPCRYGACVQCMQKKFGSLQGLESACGNGGSNLPPENSNSVALRTYITRMVAFVSGKQFTLLVLACVSLLIQSCASILLPHYQGTALDAVIANDMPRFHHSMFTFLGISGSIVAFGIVRSFLFSLLGWHITTNVRELLFEQILKQDLSFFEDEAHKTGSLLARMQSDVQLMCSPIRNLLNSLLSSTVSLVGGLFMCFYTSWRLSALAFTTIWPMMYIAKTYGKWSTGIYREIQASRAEAISVASEAFTNIRTVKAFSTEGYEMGQFKIHIREVLRKGIMDSLASSGSGALSRFADLGASFVILWFGGTVVLNYSEHLTIGGLVTFQLYWNKVNGAFSSLNYSLTTVMAAVGGSQRIFKLLFNLDQGEQEKPPVTTWFKTPNQGSDEAISPTSTDISKVMSKLRLQGANNAMVRIVDTEGKLNPKEVTGNLSLQNVEFTYSMRAKQVLKGVSVDIPSNKTFAIVGPSGGGKSTLVSLLLGLYRPSGGKILIDNYDLQNCDPVSYHRNVGVVLQQTELFARSILENITYGLRDDEWTMEDVEQACKKAYCHDFVTALDDQYRTSVGERGAQLSGGERQRIAIARALLRKPRLLFLDEATSSLDGTSEEIVQKAMQALLEEGDSTIVLVAHRLSSFRRADCIVVVKNGDIVETGTHESLLSAGGEYSKLVLPQLHSGGDDEDQVLNFD